ncbi:hypothetical protein [Streptomyces sp. NPDC056188]|uniref:hypothetical protein n=1 Tax=Streptomyces sp. NPDC056188 TaxID=3345740 RepID=UPI0035E25F73
MIDTPRGQSMWLSTNDQHAADTTAAPGGARRPCRRRRTAQVARAATVSAYTPARPILSPAANNRPTTPCTWPPAAVPAEMPATGSSPVQQTARQKQPAQASTVRAPSASRPGLPHKRHQRSKNQEEDRQQDDVHTGPVTGRRRRRTVRMRPHHGECRRPKGSQGATA